MASLLSVVTHAENFIMIQWDEHSKNGVTTDVQTVAAKTYLTTHVGYKHWQEQMEIKEIVSVDSEDRVETIYRSSWEISMIYWAECR